jgi:WD40 repeat protein
VGTGKLLRTLTGHDHTTRGLAFVPGALRCLSANYDGTVRVWDVITGKELARLPHGQGAWFVAVRPDGKQAASVGLDGKLRQWELKSFTLLRVVNAHSPNSSHGVAYSPDGKRILTCGYGTDHTVRLWDAETGKAVQVLEGHTAMALSVAFLPDGRHAVSGSYDKTVRLWKLRR